MEATEWNFQQFKEISEKLKRVETSLSLANGTILDKDIQIDKLKKENKDLRLKLSELKGLFSDNGEVVED